MVGWHHQLNGHKFEQTLGDGEGQGNLDAAVHGSQRVRFNLVTEQKFTIQFEWLLTQVHMYLQYLYVAKHCTWTSCLHIIVFNFYLNSKLGSY